MLKIQIKHNKVVQIKYIRTMYNYKIKKNCLKMQIIKIVKHVIYNSNYTQKSTFRV